MALASDKSLLEVLLDSRDRNNTIRLNRPHVLPEDALRVRAAADGHSVAELFTHLHHVRLAFVLEDVPESARDLPGRADGHVPQHLR